MGFRKLCNRLCIDVGVGRWTYLAGATCIMIGFVVEMILVGMIIAPYVQENQFTVANCKFTTSKYVNKQFCQTAERDPSNVPCLEVLANFTTVAKPSRSGGAALYVIYSYYASATLNAKCASRVCYKNTELNENQVKNLNVTLFNSGKNFTCYVRQDPGSSTENSALFTRESSEALVFHCILWPSVAFAFGMLLIWIVFCTVGCKVWIKQISY